MEILITVSVMAGQIAGLINKKQSCKEIIDELMYEMETVIGSDAMCNKIAFLFPGQGSQYINMGKDLYENIDCCKEIFDKGEEILNIPIKEMIFEGSLEELMKTKIVSLLYYLLH